jgi:hypothetical protein
LATGNRKDINNNKIDLSVCLFKGVLKVDASTEAMTEMVFAGMLGASVMYSVDKSTENLQRTIGAIIQYLHT